MSGNTTANVITAGAVVAMSLFTVMMTKQPGSAQAVIWEYKVTSPNYRVFETQVNSLGSEGWELVTCRYGSSGYECILKRPQSQ